MVYMYFKNRDQVGKWVGKSQLAERQQRLGITARREGTSGSEMTGGFIDMAKADRERMNALLNCDKLHHLISE